MDGQRESGEIGDERKMSGQRINVELLAKVRDKILAAPESYDQTTWGMREDRAPCGARACIAGWACQLGGLVTTNDLRGRRWAMTINVRSEAERLLGLTAYEACVLFTPTPEGDDEEEDDNFQAWPEPFDSLYAEASGPQARAEVAASYLNHIIKTGKVTE